MHEKGYVGALGSDILSIVKKNFYKDAKTIAIPFKVMANLEHIKLVGNILEESSLSEILKFFGPNIMGLQIKSLKLKLIKKPYLM